MQIEQTVNPIDYKLIKFALVDQEDGTIEIHSCISDTHMVINKADIPMLIGGLESYLDG